MDDTDKVLQEIRHEVKLLKAKANDRRLMWIGLSVPLAYYYVIFSSAMSVSPSKKCGRSYHFVLGIKFEHYEVEYVPDVLEVKLPCLFSHEYRHQIVGSVTLFDQRGNDFKVAVIKCGCDVFLSQGWRQIGRCLGLTEGGWIKLIYVGDGRFFMEPRDRLNSAHFIQAPARVLRLREEPRLAPTPVNGNAIVDPSMYVGHRPVAVMSFYGTLQESDLTTPYLHLPMEFCHVVFPRRDCDITLVDNSGKAWPCGLIFPPQNFNTDVLLRGWGAFADANEFPEGKLHPCAHIKKGSSPAAGRQSLPY